MAGYTQRQGGRLRPAFLPAYSDFIAELQELFGTGCGANLEIISPFLDKAGRARQRPSSASGTTSPVDPDQPARRARSGPRSPRRCTTRWTALTASVGASARRLHARLVGQRSTVARIDPRQGLPFLARAGRSAQPPRTYRAGIPQPHSARPLGQQTGRLRRARGRAGPGHWLLEAAIAKPRRMVRGEDPDARERGRSGTYVPLTITFDWEDRARNCSAGSAVAVTDGHMCQNGVPLRFPRRGAGRQLDLGVQPGQRSATRCCTRASCARSGATVAGAILLVEELNHHLKPDPLEYLELTAAEILALWSIPELRERLEADRPQCATASRDEDEDLDDRHAPRRLDVRPLRRGLPRLRLVAPHARRRRWSRVRPDTAADRPVRRPSSARR